MTRTLALAVPLAILGFSVWRVRPDRRTRGAALLAFLAAALGIAALNVVAGAWGWWSFAEVEGTHLGVPVDLWIGWALLWGPLPVLLRLPMPVLLVGLLWLDTVTMPRLEPLLLLGPGWLAGDAVGLVAVAWPAILLGRWTADHRQLVGRATLQVATFTGIAMWLVPATAIEVGDGSWPAVDEWERWQLSLLLQVAALLALPGLLAVREFVQRGQGTPYPWDPPATLVTTGPYAYVANPMQLSGVALYVPIAVFTGSWSVAAAAVLAIAFSASVAAPHEHDDLSSRHGAAWADYRARVRPWWPRWHPYLPAETQPTIAARIYLAEGCDVCSSTAEALERLGPRGLSIVAAEDYPEGLRRVKYVGHDGHAANGVAAVARALEHVSLGWAVVGWILRVPLLDRLLQVIVDGSGGGPRTLRPRKEHGSGRHPPKVDRRGDGDDPYPRHRRRLGAYRRRDRGGESGPGFLPLRQRGRAARGGLPRRQPRAG